MRWRRGFLIGSVLLLAAVGGLSASERTLTVFAAASLSDAFRAMRPEFERGRPGVKVRFNFGASSQLRAQIEQGAPADVFATADHAQMQPLAAATLVTAPRTFARNRLVVVVPASNPGKLRSAADLSRPGLRVVMTAEAVPIGRYTQEVLRKLSGLKGYGAGFSARVNANVVSREANVRSVLAKVELGEADAAVVYETDARASKRVKSLEIPSAANVVAEYPIAVVVAGRERGAAAEWATFVLSAPGQATLKRFGFR